MASMPGKNKLKPPNVIFVGAGPGDPGLITVRGVECLRQADVVVYDHLANPRLLDYAPPHAKRIYVGKRADRHVLRQEQINERLIKLATAGKRVVRLKGGDPMVFGRGGEEAEALRAAGVGFEIVPGITAGLGGMAYAGIPCTDRRVASTVVLVTGHEDPTKDESKIPWEALASIGGTLVFYMGVARLALIAEQLLRFGCPPETPTAVIEWATYPRQRTITATLGTMAESAGAAGVQPPALIVVGQAVAMRRSLRWFDIRPLFGRRVVTTRARAQASELTGRLQALGAEVIELPTIRIFPPDDPAPLQSAVAGCPGSWEWVLFTSVNGVSAFFSELANQGKDARALAGTRVAAIGPATAKALQARGLSVDLQPTKFVAEKVLEALLASGPVAGQRILLPRAAEARDVLPNGLRRAGARVQTVAAYKTHPELATGQEGVLADLSAGRIDAVTFTSSSTVRNFVGLLPPDCWEKVARSCVLASIGPVTSDTLRAHGGEPTVQADEHTIGGLVKALLMHFTARESEASS